MIQLKLRIFKNADGTRTLVVERSRPREHPTQAFPRLEEKDLDQALSWGVKAVREGAAEAGQRPV